ncbi:aminodeoxychorismate lyase [Acinetobacter rathckeae]|uniref:aminodeoxychorismate lyase n=1 Tax=Acinetobacter rathckeae TaxID=2605272 RepID=UPI0018A2AC9C|nr:aminodeoxychorismate lyase [Acinetobacter rathckeae]MBF7687606.1 aminodeoxychorismate lyase [Acinetobacter rathckeae]MBF7695008.1 aminodeoxychorismate lyase [Acinetobacter rathckeae]
MLCLKNGMLLETACVAIQDRAFQYGDGCFTTMKIQHNHISLWPRHIQRLQRDCAKLMLKPHWHYVEQLIQDMKNASELQHFTGTIKVVISRGQSQRGYGFSDVQKADVYILFYEDHSIKPSYSEIASDVLALPIATQLMPNLVGVKSLNRLEQVLLKHEAGSRDLSEALVLDTRGHIVEGVSSNCFLYVDGVWHTPQLSGNGVQGVMREEILSRMRSFGVPVYESDLSKEQLDGVDALFFCNALHPMQAVHTLSGRCLDTSITQALFNLLTLEQI